MPKLNYYDTLEGLSLLSSRAVFIACSKQSATTENEIREISDRSDGIISELIATLFSDFMPPLERESIAECAYSILRIIERASDMITFRARQSTLADQKSKEAELCIRLARSVEENVFKLRRLRRSNERPDTEEFCKLVREARSSHETLCHQIVSRGYQYQALRFVELTGALRTELTICFYAIVRIMLCNL